MQDWENWIRHNKSKLNHPVNFEERFVRDILVNILDVSPNDVTAQYPFQDHKGGNRYIDFCIKNDSKGYFVFIELDGREKFYIDNLEETLHRQNLISAEAKLLRFANTTWLNKADTVIQTIRVTLQEQAKVFVEKKKTDAKMEQLTGIVEILVKEREAQANTKLVAAPPVQAKQPNTAVYVVVVGVILLFIGIAFLGKPTNKTVSVEQSIPAQVVQQSIAQQAPTEATETYSTIQSGDAINHIGKFKTICGYVAQVKYVDDRAYINLGSRYPDQDVTVVIWPDADDDVNVVLDYGGKNLCVKGEITSYKGKPQISLSSPTQIVN